MTRLIDDYNSPAAASARNGMIPVKPSQRRQDGFPIVPLHFGRGPSEQHELATDWPIEVKACRSYGSIDWTIRAFRIIATSRMLNY
jgi:hypothetical protein